MELEKNFLAEDQDSALKELLCIVECMELMSRRILSGDFEQAKVYIEHIRRSVESLEQMKQDKFQRDSTIEELLMDLSDLGVDVHVLRLG